MQLTASVLVEILGFAALLGAGWWRIGHLEDSLDAIRDDLKADVRGNLELLKKQNSRIRDLERFRSNREGYDRGYESAKRRYGGS